MFNENFSFGSSPVSAPLTISIEDCTSADISPFTSRCSSPHTRTTASRRDSRFDIYRYANTPRHPSITALTAQLQSQALNDTDMRSPSPSPSDSAPSSPSSESEEDEGFYDGPETPATSISDCSYESPDIDPTLWDLSMSDTMATSSPRPSLSLEAQALSSYTMRRRQRQALVRLQCLATRTPDLAMLIEECHPSSLPLETDNIRAYSSKSRSGSVCNYSTAASSTNGRIDKERNVSIVSVRKAPRMRKRMATR